MEQNQPIPPQATAASEDAAERQRRMKGVVKAGVVTKFWLPLAVLALTFCACTPVEAYVQADQATYEAVAPEHTRYVVNDPMLSSEQKQRRLDVLSTWSDRLKAAGMSGASSRPSSPPTASEGFAFPAGNLRVAR